MGSAPQIHLCHPLLHPSTCSVGKGIHLLGGKGGRRKEYSDISGGRGGEEEEYKYMWYARKVSTFATRTPNKPHRKEW